MRDADVARTCVTCGDEAVAMLVLAVDAATGLARCADGHGDEREVDVALVDGVAPGSRLMVHAGTAIALAP